MTPLIALNVEEIRDSENLGSQEEEKSSARGSPGQLINSSADETQKRVRFE